MSDAPRNLTLPLVIITTILGLVHFIIFTIIVPDIPERWHIPIMMFMVSAIIAVLLGLVGGSGRRRKVMAPVTKFAYFWTGFFFLTFSFVLVQWLISLWFDHGYSYWPVIAALVATSISIFHALRPPRIVSYTLAGPPAMNGLSLVQISDLHVGMPTLNQAWLAEQVQRINKLQPDFVAITGDLADGPFSEVSPLLAPLADLKPHRKKFYVTGNHEFYRGGNWEQRLRELGFSVLHNTHEVFQTPGGRLMIAGVPDQAIVGYGSQFESSPQKALATKETVDYRILLAHEPKSVFNLKGEKCDLLLAGHTHGGQIFPFALLVRLAQPVVRGFKKVNGTLVFAHMGTGFWGPPMRWLTHSEIVRFHWTSKS